MAAVLPAAAAERFEGEEQALADVRLVSRHVTRGLERAGASLQASAALLTGGFRGELWANQPFRRSDAREVQLTGTWAQAVGTAGGLELVGRWYVYGNPPPGRANQSAEAGAVAHWTMREGLRASVGYHRDIQLQADTAEAEVDWSLPLTKWGTYLDFRFFAGWSDAKNWRAGGGSPAVRGGYGYGGVDARLPYRIGEHTTVVLGLHGSGTWNSRSAGVFSFSDRSINVAGSAGVSFDF